MSLPPDGRRRWRRKAALGVIAVIVLTGASVGASLLGGRDTAAPGTVSGPVETVGPITTGGPIAAASAAASAGAVPPQQATTIVAADSVRFSRPAYPYVGTAPWQIHDRPRPDRVLEGYASRPSYLPGETLRLAVSTTAHQYDVTFWRVTGRSTDGSPLVLMGNVPATPGSRGAAPVVDTVTKMVSVSWTYGFAYPIPTTWPTGVYLARLDGDKVQSYVPFVVRSASPHTILVVSSALNWQAYNDWGGSSVYGSTVGEPAPGVSRALGVSFDRPYSGDGGAGQLFFLELPFLRWIDAQGLDVAYTTDYDLSVDPTATPMPRVVVFNGHDEYWGPELYDWLDEHVTTAGDLGVAMLGADSGYWPVAFRDTTPDGPRSFLVLKGGGVPPALLPAGATSPPTAEPSDASGSGDTEERSNQGITSLGPDGPYTGSFDGQPLLGVRYQGITGALGRYSIDASGIDPRLLAGTNLTTGSSLGFIAGGEVDGVNPSPRWWGPDLGRYDHVFATAGLIPCRNPAQRVTAQAVWRELPSGGRVFSSGTFYWGWALDARWGPAHEVPPSFARLTLNILSFLAR